MKNKICTAVLLALGAVAGPIVVGTVAICLAVGS